jgi:hypothetical protein
MKEKLHAAHTGYDSMLRRARETIFWPGMLMRVKQIAEGCETCQTHQPSNQKQTLKQHNEARLLGRESPLIYLK